MQEPPADLSLARLVETVSRYWGRRIESVRYLPVGAGSHHWRAIDESGLRWFLTVDELRKIRIAPSCAEALASLTRAWRTTAWLRSEADLDFVVAPQEALDGSLVRRVGEHFAVTVFPFLDGEPVGPGGYADEQVRGEVVDLVGRLHAVEQSAPAPVVTVPGREEFALAADAQSGWDRGPYGEPTRELLQRHREGLRRAFATFDRTAAQVFEAGATAVFTHGEPHSANVLRRSDGRLVLIDWDTVDVAARERDLATVLPDGESDRWWRRYRQVSGAPSVSAEAIGLYELWWSLAEICEYVSRFRRPHQVDADSIEAWAELQQYITVDP